MNIALFSDVHGRLRVVLHLIRNWQLAHRAYLDSALVAGDLGCFPDISRADKATRRWMESDPEKAGFSSFFTQPHASVENLEGAMGVLHWDGASADLNILREDWLKQMHHRNWEQVWPEAVLGVS